MTNEQTDEGFYGTCEYHEDAELEFPEEKVWATTSGHNACRTCIRLRDLQPVCPWSGAIVRLPEELESR